MFPDEQLKRVPAFFADQLAANPSIAITAKLHSIESYIELQRAGMLSKVNSKDLSLTVLTDTLPFPLKTPIWYVAYFIPSQPFDAIIAPYQHSFLWLDNHVSDTDFEIFLAYQEIPLDNALNLATFLLETKFRYLTLGFRAKVISEKSDIPRWDELPPEDMAYFQDYLNEKEAKLAQISQIIAPPSLEEQSDAIHLTFFIWTLVFGNIYKLDCTFGNNGSFTWFGESLASNIGKSFVPK